MNMFPPKRKAYTANGWKWLRRACINVKNTCDQAELTYIMLKTGDIV